MPLDNPFYDLSAKLLLTANCAPLSLTTKQNPNIKCAPIKIILKGHKGIMSRWDSYVKDL
jgi:hypothetical protein